MPALVRGAVQSEAQLSGVSQVISSGPLRRAAYRKKTQFWPVLIRWISTPDANSRSRKADIGSTRTPIPIPKRKSSGKVHQVCATLRIPKGLLTIYKNGTLCLPVSSLNRAESVDVRFRFDTDTCRIGARVQDYGPRLCWINLSIRHNANPKQLERRL